MSIEDTEDSGDVVANGGPLSLSESRIYFTLLLYSRTLKTLT